MCRCFQKWANLLLFSFFFIYLPNAHTNILTCIYIYIFQHSNKLPNALAHVPALSLSFYLCVSRAAFLQLIHLSAAWKICTGIALRSASAMMNRSVSLNLHALCSYPLVSSRALSLPLSLCLCWQLLGDSDWCMFSYVERYGQIGRRKGGQTVRQRVREINRLGDMQGDRLIRKQTVVETEDSLMGT